MARFTPRNLFLISFTILFLEMSAIRWLNASVDILGYFNNLILISCFFGLGLGCLLANRKINLIRWWSPVLLAMVLGVVLLNEFGIRVSYTGDLLLLDTDIEYHRASRLWVSFSALAGFFVNVGLFVVLGQELGKQLQAVANPLVAYAYDIAGSLAGVILYALLASFGTAPDLWYGLGAAILLYFVWDRKPVVIASLVVAVGAILLMRSTWTDAEWSPYYKIDVDPYEKPELKDFGYKILVNNQRIIDAIDFDADMSKSDLAWLIPYYEVPYHLCRPRKVLVLGAGCGNEAVVARRFGAEIVHAVEIDPVIADFGTTLHPQSPYGMEGVEVFVDDARSFTNSCKEEYDLILMAALDSHKQIPGMSSLRLESFVYTVESFRRMKDLLAPEGVFCLSLNSYRPWIGDRIYWSLAEAFGEEPRRLTSGGYAQFSTAYVHAPDDVWGKDLLPDRTKVGVLPPVERNAEVLLATDNWPHLYLERNDIPGIYIVVLGGMVILSLVLVVKAEPAVRRPNLHFFFLGAGFMLLETRSVTQLALLFGSTWAVNSIVFAAILAAIFVTNLMVLKGWAPSRPISYILLLVTLVGGYFFPFDSLLGLAFPVRVAASALAVGLPIAWASFIFSSSFRQATEVGKVFGSNLLGVVLGGSLEYLSNVWGLDVLYLVALGLYVASAIPILRRNP